LGDTLLIWAAADEDTVRDVIHLFNQKGLAALDPRWAGGRPRRISDDDIEFIVTAASGPGPGRNLVTRTRMPSWTGSRR